MTRILSGQLLKRSVIPASMALLAYAWIDIGTALLGHPVIPEWFGSIMTLPCLCVVLFDGIRNLSSKDNGRNTGWRKVPGLHWAIILLALTVYSLSAWNWFFGDASVAFSSWMAPLAAICMIGFTNVQPPSLAASKSEAT